MIQYEFKKISYSNIDELDKLGNQGWNVCHVNYSELLLSRQKQPDGALVVLMVIYTTDKFEKTVNLVFQNKLEYHDFVNLTSDAINNLNLIENQKESKYYEFYEKYLSDIVLNHIKSVKFFTYSYSELINF